MVSSWKLVDLAFSMLGLYDGLKLCWNIGFKEVLCLSDLNIVVDLIQKNLNVHHKYENLIMAIKHLLCRD